jgi:small subunit ribosomal protein S7
MPRKGFVARRTVPGDAVYDSDLVQKFINSMMWDGKRSTAQRIFTARWADGQKANAEPLALFEGHREREAGAGSEIATRGRREHRCRGEVNPFRRQSLAIRWLLLHARTRPGKRMMDKLAEELLDAANGKGGAMKKKEDVHRMAEANKAFAHYRW